MNLEPTLDRVIVKKETARKQGSLYLPDSQNDRKTSVPTFGTVIKIGPGTLFNTSDGKIVQAPMNIKIGMLVLFAPEQATEFTFENEKYFLMNESAVLAISTK